MHVTWLTSIVIAMLPCCCILSYPISAVALVRRVNSPAYQGRGLALHASQNAAGNRRRLGPCCSTRRFTTSVLPGSSPLPSELSKHRLSKQHLIKNLEAGHAQLVGFLGCDIPSCVGPFWMGGGYCKSAIPGWSDQNWRAQRPIRSL